MTNFGRLFSYDELRDLEQRLKRGQATEEEIGRLFVEISRLRGNEEEYMDLTRLADTAKRWLRA